MNCEILTANGKATHIYPLLPLDVHRYRLLPFNVPFPFTQEDIKLVIEAWHDVAGNALLTDDLLHPSAARKSEGAGLGEAKGVVRVWIGVW